MEREKSTNDRNKEDTASNPSQHRQDAHDERDDQQHKGPEPPGMTVAAMGYCAFCGRHHGPAIQQEK
jgi:hypothetical protein